MTFKSIRSLIKKPCSIHGQMALSDLLTNDILDSYAAACCRIGEDLWTFAMDRKHGHLLMPSRGAFPIHWHGVTSFDRQLAKHHNYDNSRFIKDKFSIPSLNEIWLPFTAYSTDNAISSALQRRHWCLVLKSILDGADTPSWRLHSHFVDQICNQRFDHVSGSSKKPKGLVVIDTVVSGRAVTEIADAFDSIGIRDYVFLLAVDENGGRMKEPYAARINKMEALGKAKLYYMERIFTEDSHPGLTGVTAVVFPQITTLLNQDSNNGSTVGFWHLEVAKRPDGMNLPFTITASITQTAIFRRICAMLGEINDPYKFEDDSYDKEQLKRQEDLGSEDRKITRDFILPVVKRGSIANAVENVEVSSSYIASVHLDEQSAQRIAEKLVTLYNR